MTALLENSIHTTYHYALTLRTLKIGNVYKECNGEGERKLTLVSVSPTTRSIQCADSLYNPCTFTYNAQRRSWISDSDATAHLEVPVRMDAFYYNGRVGIPSMTQANEAPDPFPIFDPPKQHKQGGIPGG